jgi:CSLREA domain-containing protein
MSTSRFGRIRGPLAFAVACLVLAFTAPAALAAPFTVNTTADSSDVGGCTSVTVCSLRDAVAAANAAPGSTINVPAGRYTLNTGSTPLGQLALTAATTIIGAGARETTIDGNGQSRVFDYEPATVTDVLELENLTITGGSAQVASLVTDPGDGGGIFSLGGLDLEHVAVTGNTAQLGGGGVMDGTIHTGATPGPATFNGVTIADNHVQGGVGNGQGGGAVVATTLTMTNSTIANNSTANAGLNEGGGLVNAIVFEPTSATATLVNDTITGNAAAEPVASPAGDFGGGISGDQFSSIVDEPLASVIDATNTLVAGNTADGTEGDCSLLDTADGSSSHDIQGDSSCGFSDADSKTTTAIKLGTLRNNGGPTDTFVPDASSPAVNAGTATGCPATDERGVTRPQGSVCDIGAVELAPPVATTGAATSVTATGATVAGTAGNPAVAQGGAAFQFGTTTAYGTSDPAGPVAAGASGAKETLTLSGLTPNTLYHYRLLVATSDGVANGNDATFTTPKIATSVAVACVPSTVVVGARTTCKATVANADAHATGTPTGKVRLRAGRGSFGNGGICTLKPNGSGTAACSVSYTAGGTPGSQSLEAAYGGDGEHTASTGSRKLAVERMRCGAPSGSLLLAAAQLGPVKLGDTRAATRKLFRRFMERGRRNMDFFCLSGTLEGMRVGYLGGRAALVLTSNHRYHVGSVRPGDSLAKAERTLTILTHFRVGLNHWYFTTGTGSDGVLKVRHGEVEEVGIALRSRTQTRATAYPFITSFR